MTEQLEQVPSLSAEKAREALAALEQAWSYYTPLPTLVARDQTDRAGIVFPEYYAA